MIILNVGGLPPDKQIYELARKVNTPIRSIVKTKSGVLVHFTNSEDAVRYSEDNKALGVGKIMLSEEALSQFMIRVKKTSDAWADYSDDEIMDDIAETYNSEVASLFYDRQKKWAKIAILSRESISKILDKGLMSLGSITPPQLLEKDIRVNIKICHKCFSYDHNTAKCTKTQRCLKCGGEHETDSCARESATCLHCGGAHNPLAFRCPKRKELVAQKIKEIKDRRRQEPLPVRLE